RLNAVGRIGDANDGLRLLLTENPQEAAALARELETINARRQEMDQLILDEAIEIVEQTLQPTDAAIVLGADTWHPGVIGIVASRLVERYGRPTFLVGWDEAGEFGRGSGRSIPGFDLHGGEAGAGVRRPECAGRRRAPRRDESLALHAGRRLSRAAGDRVPLGGCSTGGLAHQPVGCRLQTGAGRLAREGDDSGASGES